MDEYAQRAEVFDALSHPTRIRLLKILHGQTLSFADLKKRMRIESGGHLQHHLSKLGNLVKTDAYGRYSLSEQGEDALFAMETIEKVAKSSENSIRFTSLRKRMFSTIIILLLASASVISGFYVYSSGLMWSQYYYDAVKGSPLKEGAHIWTGSSYYSEIPKGETYRYTAMVFSTLTPSNVSVFHDDYGTFHVLASIINATYYRMSFIGFRINLTADERFEVYFGPVIGPNNSEVYKIVDPYEAPPYRVEPIQPFGHAASGGLQIVEEYHVPITTFGNYTFQITNTGNVTVKICKEIWAATVTMETKPLTGSVTFPASIRSIDEKVVRLKWQPTPIHLIAILFSLGSIITLTTLSIYMLNRKFYIKQ